MRRFLALWHADRGAAVIELAIVAPMIALMTIGVVDMSNGFNSKLRVEQAAQRSIEKVMQTTGITNVETTIANEAMCQFNGTLANGDCKTAPLTAANIQVTNRLECDGVEIAAEECADEDQVESKWIKVTVWTDYEPLFPVHFRGISNGKYRINASAGMRTK